VIEGDRGALINALETLAQFGVPAKGAARLIDIGTADYLNFVRRELLDDFVSAGASTCRVYEGPYGVGKTHLLQLLEDEGRDAGFAVARADLSQALGFETPRALVRYVLEHITFELDGQIVRSLPTILGRLGPGVETDLHGASMPHHGFATGMRQALRGAGGGEGATLLRRFLLGERVSSLSLRRYGILGVKNPLSDRNAEKVLRTVTAGLRQFGIRGTLLLFDETEPTLSSGIRTTTKITASANLMRRLIDQSASGGLVATLTVFAVLPGFIESASSVYPALGQRLTMRTGSTAPWRMPTLPVDQASTAGTREAFVAAAVRQFVELGERLGAPPDGLELRLEAEGHLTLEGNAGGGYRRELMKRFATVLLKVA
jgi:hypothetical protein